MPFGDDTTARRQLEVILANVQDGILAQTPEGTLLYANDAAMRMMGFASREDLAAATPAERMSAPLVRAIPNKQLGPVLATYGRQAIYVWNREPKGRMLTPEQARNAKPGTLFRTTDGRTMRKR